MSYPESVKKAIEDVKFSSPHREGNPTYKKKADSSLYFGDFVKNSYISFSRVLLVPEATEVIDAITYSFWQISDECVYDSAGKLVHREFVVNSKLLTLQV